MVLLFMCEFVPRLTIFHLHALSLVVLREVPLLLKCRLYKNQKLRSMSGFERSELCSAYRQPFFAGRRFSIVSVFSFPCPRSASRGIPGFSDTQGFPQQIRSGSPEGTVWPFADDLCKRFSPLYAPHQVSVLCLHSARKGVPYAARRDAGLVSHPDRCPGRILF